MATYTRQKPRWWKADYDSAWDRIKAAFRRDWEQTKHDFGGDEPDLNQDVPDTVGQAMGTRPIPPEGVPNFEENEPAYRFGYGARRNYGDATWDPALEKKLRADWGDDWDRFRPAVRRGWEYEE
jgi:hypothetical protein